MDTTTATGRAVIRVFDGTGDTIVKEYDPVTADMEEVNKFIHDLEEKMHGRAFNLGTGEAVGKATREDTDIAVLPQWCGG